jgi:carbonic anhydrase
MRIRNHCHAVIIDCALASAAATAEQEQHPAHTWDYSQSHGPAHWAELGPEFAPYANGHHQSPIDIRNPQRADLPPIQFDYKPSPLDIIDNGHTIMINYAPGSFISVGGKQYELKQFHFHRPSEERINGKAYEMTVHLVHADQQGKLAVVAVLLQREKTTLWCTNFGTTSPKRRTKKNISTTSESIWPDCWPPIADTTPSMDLSRRRLSVKASHGSC